MVTRMVQKRIWMYWFGLLCLCTSCANRGIGPQGGPRDTIPPRVVQESPLNGSVHCQPKKIEVVFDEYIQLDNVQSNLLISPPQQVAPVINAIGKKLTCEFQEPLLDSTTYTLDFGAAICDFHEKIPLTSYLFAFSTGDDIDSLSISGQVIDAQTLNPYANILVGIHSNIDDSAFSTLPFTRVARTDSAGFFAIRNVRAGHYRLYALNDVSRDFMYQPGESLAFIDSVFIPQCSVSLRQDTIYRDSLSADSLYADSVIHVVDSIATYLEHQYSPADIVLWHFRENKQAHYFQRVLREEPHRFTLFFSAPQDPLPCLEALPLSVIDSTYNDSAWVNPLPYVRLQVNATRDTLVYWLTDSLAIAQDSIVLRMTYLKSDSLYELRSNTDTIKVIYRAPRMSEKALETKRKADLSRKLQLSTNARSQFDIYDTIRIHSAYPLHDIDSNGVHLFLQVDTLWKEVAGSLVGVDSAKMNYQYVASLQMGSKYELRIDSAAFRDIYGVVNNSYQGQLTLKRKEDYAQLRILVPNSLDVPLRLQLLSEQEKIVREQAVVDGAVSFSNIAANTYYLRLYIDINHDGNWTTGDWQTKRQPEPVYYCPSKLKLRANWDFEETFDFLALPQISSKPIEIRKNAGQKK